MSIYEIAVSGDNSLDPGRVPYHLKAFATVSLSRDLITSLIFRIRSSVLL